VFSQVYGSVDMFFEVLPIFAVTLAAPMPLNYALSA
jgi:hypothetical protein